VRVLECTLLVKLLLANGYWRIQRGTGLNCTLMSTSTRLEPQAGIVLDVERARQAEGRLSMEREEENVVLRQTVAVLVGAERVDVVVVTGKLRTLRY
jgi:hypothetical protein